MPEKIIVYQKPSCTKCRTTLKLLTEEGVDFDAVNYYEESLTPELFKELLGKLGMRARDVLRKDEAVYRELGLGKSDISDDELIVLMVAHPDLIQRPIVVRGNEAVLGRPPENVKKLL
jgi:arsenate reductase